eukprot:441460-Lingulodinium_polyedra.AAC.1
MPTPLALNALAFCALALLINALAFCAALALVIHLCAARAMFDGLQHLRGFRRGSGAKGLLELKQLRIAR